MRTAKYFWQAPKTSQASTTGSDDEDVTPEVPVVCERVSRYGNQDLYSPPDSTSRSADIETRETLDAKDYDHKLPLKLAAEQIDSLVEFIKDKPIFYDKKQTGWIDKNERLSLLQTWCKEHDLNGTHLTLFIGLC